MRLSLLIILSFFGFSIHLLSQCIGCGPGGGGLGASGARLGLATAETGNIQFQGTYNFNFFNDLYDGSLRLDNDYQRIINSGFFEVNYGISHKLSVAGIIGYLDQEIKAATWDGTIESDRVRGLGDLVLVIKYMLMDPWEFNGWQIVAGLGPKLPTGRTSELSSDGSLFSLEMQPGTGSFDVISWTTLSKSNFLMFNLSLNTGATYLFSGENRNTGNGQSYRYGNEFQYTAGLNYQFYYRDIAFDVFNYLLYRHQSPAVFDENPIARTGGHWLFASPGFQINPRYNLSLFCSADIPVYRNLEGPQLTATYGFSLGIMYNLSVRN